MLRKILIVQIFTLFISFIAKAQFPANGDFETGTFTNYTGYHGAFGVPPLVLSTFTPSFSGISITTPGSDPNISSISTVRDGAFSCRVGLTSHISDANILSYTFTATSSTEAISFQYAVLFEKYHPVISDNGFFTYWVSSTNVLTNSTSYPNLIYTKTIDCSDPTLSSVPSSYGGEQESILYHDWQEECVPLSNLLPGQQYTIYFAAQGCSLGGHFGYAYIDDLSAGAPSFTLPSYICSNANGLIADATSTGVFEDGQWSMFQLNSNNINDVVSGTTSTWPLTPPSKWGPGNMIFDIGNAYFPWTTITSLNKWHSGSPNGYYGVTLQVKNCAGQYVTTSQIVDIELPKIQADNVFICCKDLPETVTLKAEVDETTPSAGGVITWYDESGTNLGTGTTTIGVPSGGGTSTISILTTNVTSSTKYHMVYTNAAGCSNDKWIYCLPVDLEITSQSKWGLTSIQSACLSTGICTGVSLYPNPIPFAQCDGTSFDADELNALLNYPFTYSWSTGETTSHISTADHPGVTSYSVTISDQCGHSLSGSITLPGSLFHGSFPALNYTTGVTSGQNFVVYDSTVPVGFAPAYNATYYELDVFDRYGNELAKIENHSGCNGFYNGAISWDCNGGTLDLGTYYFDLYLTNCDGTQKLVIKGGDFTFTP